jgi:hypothetical protein
MSDKPWTKEEHQPWRNQCRCPDCANWRLGAFDDALRGVLLRHRVDIEAAIDIAKARAL